MTEGLKIRAAIDVENVKGLLLINGGAAVALLAFIPQLLEKSEAVTFTYTIFWSLLFFTLGLLFAILHNRLRRKCSLIYDLHTDKKPPHCKYRIPWTDPEPCVCLWSIVLMYCSILAFLAGSLCFFVGGLRYLETKTTMEHPTLIHATNTPRR